MVVGKEAGAGELDPALFRGAPNWVPKGEVPSVPADEKDGKAEGW